MNDPTKMLLEIMREDINELKADVKTLLQFKWQIIGGSLVVSSIIALVISIMGQIVSRV